MLGSDKDTSKFMLKFLTTPGHTQGRLYEVTYRPDGSKSS